jgi:glutathione peroxidase
MISKGAKVMRLNRVLVVLVAASFLNSGVAVGAKPRKLKSAQATSFHDFTVKDIDGKRVKLEQFRGDVCLVVNVASKCGLTPQYSGLESLYRAYKDRGFQILGFPANNFGKQEPGSNKEIKSFCEKEFDVTFPMFAKISVAGPKQSPLYRFLTEHNDESIAGEVAWNFQKYLVGRDGRILKKFEPRTTPDDKELVAAVESALEAAQEAAKPEKTP